jgi:hypothetical protein
MSNLRVNIYTSGDALPQELSSINYFHSPQLFKLCEHTPRLKPFMVTLSTPDGHICAQMLAVVRYRSSWFPPYYYKHCRITGEGVYHSDDAPTHFGTMIQSLTERLGHRTLYVEVSHLGQKMFGYRQLRGLKFFPVRWMSIHNSLHSHTPEERITPQMQRRIDAAYEHGVTTYEVKSEDDFKEFMRLLRHHNWLKPKRYIPDDEFFRHFWNKDDTGGSEGRLFVTRFRNHIIGCSAVVYSHRQSFLWFAAYRRKTYAWVHPRELTVWHAIKDSHQRGYEHIFFMDVGLPFRKNKFRDFILRFGGKPVSTYRWFRFSIKWLNSLLTWIYRK